MKRECFDKKNIALFDMIKTTEKLEANRFKNVEDLQKLLDRANLDRPFLVKEKMKCIWSDKSYNLHEVKNLNKPYSNNNGLLV